jgi:hypothetical protein
MATLGLMASHQHLTGTGVDQPTEHFERGRLAGAIGSEKAHHLPGSNRERHIPNRRHIPLPTTQKMAQGAGQTRLLVSNAVRLAQPFDRDQWRVQRSQPELNEG